MSHNTHYYMTGAVIATGVISSAYYFYRVYRDKQKSKFPKEWTQVGTLKTLCIYPIKSCGPVFMEKADVTLLGLRDGSLRDRILMVVDDKNNFVTARTYPELLLVNPSVKNSVLTLKHDDMETIIVNLAEVAVLEEPFTATVWGCEVPVYDCGKEPSEWFSKLLNQPDKKFRLVYYASNKPRTLRKSSNMFFKFTKNDTGIFPDEVPFNLINEASVDDLNQRLKDSKVSYRNFRPNFLLTGAKPLDEDNWKFVKIGDNVFEIIKPCTRCVLTTIDPETGIRHPNSEPLETLKSYRQETEPRARAALGSSPKMGLQLALRSEPTVVARGDPVYVA